ncbi:MAG: hypothetical protein LC795_08560 [Acidobacteria bacterium]|nr:hypothetical protein [Acidobacteriota bacterium]
MQAEKGAAAVGHAREPGGGVKNEGAAVEDSGRGPRAWKGARLASAQRRRQRPAPSARAGAVERGGAPALEAMSAGGGVQSLFESTRLMTKEQLVYALRLTGAKLRDVRPRTRGREGSEPRAGRRDPGR